VWTLSQLLGREEFAALAADALSAEADDGVRAEWQRAGTNVDPSSPDERIRAHSGGAASSPRLEG
jgi:hypothetical protein